MYYNNNNNNDNNKQLDAKHEALFSEVCLKLDPRHQCDVKRAKPMICLHGFLLCLLRITI